MSAVAPTPTCSDSSPRTASPTSSCTGAAQCGHAVAVVAELTERLGATRAAGISATQVVIDPGIGFATTAAHNWQLLAGLDRLHVLGHALLLGASRKAFLGSLLPASDGTPRPPDAGGGDSRHLSACRRGRRAGSPGA